MRLPLALALAAALLAGCAPASDPDTAEPMPNVPGQLVPDVEPTVTDPDAPLVAFYGDSYTLGTGASDRAHRWSTIICTDRGWNEFNPSVNGLGFVNNRRADFDEPDMIIEIGRAHV